MYEESGSFRSGHGGGDLKTNALSLQWVLGLNYRMYNGVHNLTNDNRSEIFYVSAHTGVIYDYRSKKSQRLLQGHCNRITATAYNQHMDILVTVDKGPDSLLVVWDIEKGIPTKTIFDPHPFGTESIDVSPDGRYIVSLSRAPKNQVQKGTYDDQWVAIWDRTSAMEGPLSTGQLNTSKEAGIKDYHYFVKFNTDNIFEFSTTGRKTVRFWSWGPGEDGCRRYSPVPAAKEAHQKKEFTQTVFIPRSTQAISGTTEGLLVVWDISLIMEDYSQPDQRRQTKMITLFNTSGKVEHRAKKYDKGKKRQAKEEEEGSGNNKEETKEDKAKGQNAKNSSSGNEPGHSELVPGIDEGKEKKRKKVKVTENKKKVLTREVEVVGISVLAVHDKYIIVGSTNGSVRFYDFGFRIKCWFENINLSEVTSISFSNCSSEEIEIRKEEEEEPDDKINSRSEYSFKCQDFVVVDMNAQVRKISSQQFEEIDEPGIKENRPESSDSSNSGGKYNQTILKTINHDIEAFSAKPNSTIIAFALSDGSIYEWDYAKKKNKLKLLDPGSTASFKDDVPSALAYSPDSRYLIVGTSGKNIRPYDFFYKESGKDTPWDSVIQVTIKKNIVKIIQISFAENSQSFAAMDDEFCVSLYKIGHKYGDQKAAKEFLFSGKVKCHFLPLTGICFGESLDPTSHEITHRLFSISQDKQLIEYKVKEAQKNNLEIESTFQLEQESIPTACVWYPVNYLKEDVIVVANSDYKIKLWNVHSKDKKICKQTLLGPTYGGPINKLLYLEIDQKLGGSPIHYLCYSTEKKIIGIIRLPMDGNPNKTLGLIAHPGKIKGMTCSSDGRLIFTAGVKDKTINIWGFNDSIFEESLSMFNETENPLDIYPSLLEGGKDGQLYRDLKDFFYYSQIRSKDENTTKARKIDKKIPVNEIPFMMSALGYYPTQKELENMQNEVRYSNLHQNRESEVGEELDLTVNDLELDTFVRLFINHRPVYGVTKGLIQKHLEVLGRVEMEEEKGSPNAVGSKTNKNAENGGKVSAKKFVELMQNYGEKMSVRDLKECLNILVGEGEMNEFANEKGDPDSMMMKEVLSLLPEFIDQETMMKEILGFEDENMGEEEEEEIEEGSPE